MPPRHAACPIAGPDSGGGGPPPPPLPPGGGGGAVLVGEVAAILRPADAGVSTDLTGGEEGFGVGLGGGDGKLARLGGGRDVELGLGKLGLESEAAGTVPVP